MIISVKIPFLSAYFNEHSIQLISAILHAKCGSHDVHCAGNLHEMPFPFTMKNQNKNHSNVRILMEDLL